MHFLRAGCGDRRQFPAGQLRRVHRHRLQRSYIHLARDTLIEELIKHMEVTTERDITRLVNHRLLNDRRQEIHTWNVLHSLLRLLFRVNLRVIVEDHAKMSVSLLLVVHHILKHHRRSSVFKNNSIFRLRYLLDLRFHFLLESLNDPQQLVLMFHILLHHLRLQSFLHSRLHFLHLFLNITNRKDRLYQKWDWRWRLQK